MVQHHLLDVTTISDRIDLEARIISSTSSSSNAKRLIYNMTTNEKLTVGNALSSNTINGAHTFSQN